MVVMGVEFNASNMNYVVIHREGDKIAVVTSNRLTLGNTRSPEDLRAFQTALLAILHSVCPERIAIKQKNESGTFAAGAAALKMEGVVLANSPCRVEFVSGQRISKAEPVPGLPKYLQPAAMSALAAN